MAKIEMRARYLVAKPQKGRTLYYWQPSRRLRADGWLPRRLSDDLGEAIRQAQQYSAELDAARTGNDRPEQLREGTVAWLIGQYRKDPRFKEKAESTQRGYEQALVRIEEWAGDVPIKAVHRRDVIQYHRALYARTPAFANAIGRVLRIVFKFAFDLGHVESNPAEKLGMEGRPPRHAIWTEADQTSFVAKANESCKRSMALALLLAVSTGQRQGDVLRMAWSQYDGTAIKLRQGKTGRWIEVPLLRELKNALEGTPRISTQIVVSEVTGKPYRADHFRHLFKEICSAAGIEGLQFRDLRRTAVVRLAEAGCTTPQIAAITGHEIARCERILETYLPRTSEMARQGIARLEEYRQNKKS